MKHKSREEKTEIQTHLENLFADLKPNDTAPKDTKEQVFDTIATIELVGDIMELFTGKFGQTEIEFLDLLQEEEEETEE